jgi:serine/threonine-protein kinase RsbW
MNGEYLSRFPSMRHAASAARRDLIAFISTFDFPEDILTDIETAVGEALANAAEHGHKPGSMFEVRAYAESEMLVVEIEDAGGGFEHSHKKHGVSPAHESPRGFGIFIMQHLMDAVEYNERGTLVRLKKRLPESAQRAPAEDDVTGTG